MREKNAKFWRISSGDETAVLARMTDDTNDLETSIEELKTVYNEISGDWIKIKANNILIEGKGGDTRSSAYEWRVRCKNNSEKEILSPKIDNPFGSGAMFSKYLELMERNFQLQREHDRELTEYKNKELIRELEARAEGKNSGYMLEGISLLKKLMDPNETNEAGIHGPEEKAPAKPVIGSNGEKIKNALKTLASVDKNLANNLELLAKLARKDPNTYNMAVNYLKTL
jgi:hypothetical protein